LAIIRNILSKEIVMKKHPMYLAIAVLVLASLACQAVMGAGDTTGGDPPPVQDNVATESPEANEQAEEPSVDSGGTGDSNTETESEFPMTADAYDLVDVGDGTLIFYTKLSGEEALESYRDEYTSKGYTEREILTVITDDTFSIVFDGDPSGQAVVIQSVDLGDGSRTITIWLEDV
jgi:hypothetical protein